MDVSDRPKKTRRIIIDDEDIISLELPQTSKNSLISTTIGFFTERCNTNLIPKAKFNRLECVLVGNIDNIDIYREGNRFHAVNKTDKEIISRNILFDFIHEVIISALQFNCILFKLK